MKLTEWTSIVTTSLTREQVAAIAAHPALAIAPVGFDSWRVTASQYVGTVQVPGLSISIAPKISVMRLMKLLCESLEIINWSDSMSHYEVQDDLLSIVADTWCLFAEKVITQGLMQGYKSTDDALFGIRGRIRLADQMTRHAGIAIPVEVTYDEYTPDVLENQLMAGACRLLMRLPAAETTRMRLKRMAKALVDITPTPAQSAPPEPTWNRLNQRYRGVAFLSRLILKASSLEKGATANTSGASFLVDMNRVFEDVVGVGIKRDIERKFGGKLLLQHSQPLDQSGLFHIRPDLLWQRNDEFCAVGDLKYKLPDSRSIAISDVYQAVVYATRYRLDTCFLIFAEQPEQDKVVIEDKTIIFKSIDIGAENEIRQWQIGRLSADIDRIVTRNCMHRATQT